MKKILILFTFILLLVSSASADLGPKPTVHFDVTYNGQPPQDGLFSAKMLACQDKDTPPSRDIIPQLNISQYDSQEDCYWMPAEFAWGGQCTSSTCKFTYFPPNEFKLAIYLESQDQVFISEKATRNDYNSNYKANLLPGGSIHLEDVTPFSQSSGLKRIKTFFFALFITLVFELLTALVFVSISKDSKRLLIPVFIASIITLPIVWFVFPLLKILPLVIILAESFAVVFEAYFIYYFSRKTFSLKKSFLLSFIMNAVSFFIGGVIFVVIKFLFLF